MVGPSLRPGGRAALPGLSGGIRGDENHGVPNPDVRLLFRAPALSVFISCNIHHTGLFMEPSLGSYFSGLVNKTLAFAACHGGWCPSDVNLKNCLFFFPTTALLQKFICILLGVCCSFSPLGWGVLVRVRFLSLQIKCWDLCLLREVIH